MFHIAGTFTSEVVTTTDQRVTGMVLSFFRLRLMSSDRASLQRGEILFESVVRNACDSERDEKVALHSPRG